MKKIGLLIGAILTLTSFCFISGCVDEGKEFRPTINEVKPLIDECKSIGNKPISIQGKVIVWKVPDDSLSPVQGMIDKDLKANLSDSEITIFLTLEPRNVLMGYYSVSNKPGYRQYVDVCVVYWPAKKAVGMHSVVSKEPPSSRPVSYYPGYGDPNQPIADWINSLPRN